MFKRGINKNKKNKVINKSKVPIQHFCNKTVIQNIANKFLMQRTTNGEVNQMKKLAFKSRQTLNLML